MRHDLIKFYTTAFIFGAVAGLAAATVGAQTNTSTELSTLTPRILLMRDKSWPVKNEFHVKINPTPGVLSLEIFEHIGNQSIAQYKLNKTKQKAQIYVNQANLYQVKNRASYSPQGYALYRGPIKSGFYPLSFTNAGNQNQELEIASYPNNEVVSRSFTAAIPPTQQQAILGNIQYKANVTKSILLHLYNAPKNGILLEAPNAQVFPISGSHKKWTSLEIKKPLEGNYKIIGNNNTLRSIAVGIRSNMPIQIQTNTVGTNFQTQNIPDIRFTDTLGQDIPQATYQFLQENGKRFVIPILPETHDLESVKTNEGNFNSLSRIEVSATTSQIEFLAKQTKTAIKLQAEYDDCNTIKPITTEILVDSRSMPVPSSQFIKPTILDINKIKISRNIESEALQQTIGLGSPQNVQIMFKAKPNFYVNAPSYMQQKSAFFIDVITEFETPFDWEPLFAPTSEQLTAISQLTERLSATSHVTRFFFTAMKPGIATVAFHSPTKSSNCKPPTTTITITPNIRKSP
jgi:hypothetical protein